MKKALIVLMMALLAVSLFISCGEDPFFHAVSIKYEDKVVKTEIVYDGDEYTLPSKVDGIPEIGGWTIDGKEYNVGDKITVTGDITITAVIGTPVVITLYDDVTTTVYVKKGETEFTLPVKPTRDGYDFDGWKVDGTVKNPGDKVTYTEGMTISAVWTKLYYVTYYNGTTLVETKSFREGAGLELNDGKALSNGNLIFTGWSRTNGSKTAEFAGGSTYSENKDITLYAVWSSDISIIYMSEGVQVQKVSGSPADMKTWTPDSTVTKTGYVFDGWYTAEKGEGTYYAVDASITTSMTLYAHWVDNHLSFYDVSGKDDEKYVTSSNTSSLVIPSVYNGKKVTTLNITGCVYLGSISFEKASNITNITSLTGTTMTSLDLSGTSITQLKSGSLSNNEYFTSVKLPSTLTTIVNGAFNSCNRTGMTIYIDLPKNSIAGAPWGDDCYATVKWRGEY